MTRSALAIAVALVASAGSGAHPAPDAERAWRAWDQARRVEWGEAQIDSLAAALVAGNRRAVTAIDSLYRAGAYGPAGSDAAIAGAHRAFKCRALGPFDYIAALAADSLVRQSDERGLHRPFGETYVNMGAFPVEALARARLGRGRFCLDYDAREGFRAVTEMLVGKPITVRAEVVHREGEDRRVLRLPYPSGVNGTLDLLFDVVVRGTVERRTAIDRGDTLDFVLLRDLEGFYVRKWGIHKLGGIAAWRTRAGAGPRAADPARLRVGAVAYFPHIDLHLPGFLPDLGLDDLREFHVPRPIWERSYVRDADGHPAWLGLDPTGAMLHWEQEGPRPTVLETIFPDL